MIKVDLKRWGDSSTTFSPIAHPVAIADSRLVLLKNYIRRAVGESRRDANILNSHIELVLLSGFSSSAFSWVESSSKMSPGLCSQPSGLYRRILYVREDDFFDVVIKNKDFDILLPKDLK